MALEFNKVVDQVYKLGAMVDKLDFDFSERLQIAFERFQRASDLDTVREHIEWVRQPEVSGYRGAAALDIPEAEPINLIVPAPEMPAQATLIAVDGSQIYPDEQAPVHYYLINTGLFVYHHGSERTPEPFTYPKLVYHKDHVHDPYGRVVSNRTVDDRRTVAEIQRLAEAVWERRHEVQPLVALYDNRLLYLPGSDNSAGRGFIRDYLGALVHLHDAGAILAGYIDNPFGSRRFVQLLYLLSLESEEEVRLNQVELSRAGDLDGLRDREFFSRVLGPGERSAIMVQNSPQNYLFKERGISYEIAFFYLNVSTTERPHIVRVDTPLWVARETQAVAELHALLLAQCRMQGRNPYPYALTRADELAVVSGRDRDRLGQLIATELRKQGIVVNLTAFSAKSRGKELARSVKRRFEIRPEI